jgi:hypothetical protein
MICCESASCRLDLEARARNKREAAVIRRYSHELIFRWHFWWHLDCQILAECDARGLTGIGVSN